MQQSTRSLEVHMYTNNAGGPGNGNTITQAETPAALDGTSDSNFFTAQLNPSERPGKGTAPTGMGLPLTLGPAESATLSKRVSKGFRDMSLNKKTKDAHEFAQSLSESHVNVVAGVKVLGAIVKGVDKVASMG